MRMEGVVTTLHIGAAPVTKPADQLAAEDRERIAARRRLVGNVLDGAVYAAHVALCLLLVLLVYVLYGGGPFAGTFMLLFG